MLQDFTLPQCQANWLREVGVSDRDLLTIASDFGPEHPEQTIAIGLIITDATLRDRSLQKLMSRWAVDSLDEALAVLKRIPLSEAQRNYLTNLLPRD